MFLKTCKCEVKRFHITDMVKSPQILMRQNSRAKQRRNCPRGLMNLFRPQTSPDNYLGYSLFSEMDYQPCCISPNKKQSFSSDRKSLGGLRYMTSHPLKEMDHLPQGKWCVRVPVHPPTLEQAAMMQGEC